MDDQFMTPSPACSNMKINPSDIVQSSTIIEEGPRICPLCHSIVKSFYISFNEKMVMCENPDCEFPFGYEELQLYQVCEEESTAKSYSVSCTGSIISAAEQMDIEKINRAYDSEDNQSEYRAFINNKPKEMSAKEKETQNQIKKNIKKIRELNEEMCRDEMEAITNIRNKKWIENLLDMQETSGMKLVKENEFIQLKKQEPEIGLRELKIDIDPNEISMSTIKIELKNLNHENP